MTPKEKAEELINEMHYQICSDNGLSESDTTKLCAKQCALIAVDEILEAKTKILDKGDGWQLVECSIYWKEVKNEIENL